MIVDLRIISRLSSTKYKFRLSQPESYSWKVMNHTVFMNVSCLWAVYINQATKEEIEKAEKDWQMSYR